MDVETDMIETPARLNRLARSLWAVFARPVKVSSDPKHHPVNLATYVLGFGAVVSMFAASIASGPIDWKPVLILGVLCILGETFEVSFGSLKFTCSDVFYGIAFVALPLSSAAFVLAISMTWLVLRFPRSLQSTAVVGSSASLPMLAGLLGLHAISPALSSLPGTWGVVASVAAVYSCVRVAEMAMLWWGKFWGGEGTASQRARKASQVTAGFAKVVIMPTLSQAPMSMLGVFAFPATPWVTGLLVVPFVMSWYSARQEEHLAVAQASAKTDALTGLFNRAGTFDHAAEEIDAAKRYGHSIAVIMGDLDNFKRVNDTLGHIVGDTVLAATADCFRESIHSSRHIVGRYGGEEFVVVAVALTQDETRALAEALRATVERALGEYQSSISLGIAYMQENDRLESLIDRADKALYSAKFAGKNRVHEFPSNLQRPIAVRAA
jgi:diguanylate cyclase (GGDEF)-like protein